MDMSQLVARILLAILMFPAAAVLFLTTLVYTDRRAPLDWWGCLAAAGGGTWAFVAAYWYCLWRASVRWTPQRRLLTFLATPACAGCGLLVYWGLHAASLDDGFAALVSWMVAPLLWLIATVLLWRERPAERAARLAGNARGAIVCPTCGYNLTGLREARCPECGSQFTVDQLPAAQPARANADLDG